MKALKILLLSSLVLIGQGEPVSVSQSLFWEQDNLDVEGNPDLIIGSDVAVSEVGQDLNLDGQPLRVVAGPASGAEGVLLDPLLRGLKPGEYLLWARLIDANAIRSDWSVPKAIRFDQVRPRPPRGLVCR